jgi:hypothetical protein
MGEEAVDHFLTQHVAAALQEELWRQIRESEYTKRMNTGTIKTVFSGWPDTVALAKVSIEARDNWMQEK